MRRVRHSNSRKLNAVEAGRFSRRRSVLRGQCNSNSSHGHNRSNGHNRSHGRNHSLKRNALPDLPSSHGRKANVLVVQPNDHSKTPGRHSRRNIRADHLPNAVAEAAKASPVNPANRSNTKDADGDPRSITIRVNPPSAHSRNSAGSV